MFEPFRDQNPHFFGKISLSWFVMQDFRKLISSIVLWTNHSEKFVWGKTQIFVELTFFDQSEIEVFLLTWRVTLCSRCILNTLQSQITYFKRCLHLLVKNLRVLYLELLFDVKFFFFIFWRLSVTVCERG